MLIGRESELSLLAERIEERQAVAVLGEAGVGKTALVRAASGFAGKRLYEAGALATLSWLPYLPLHRAFGRDFDGDAGYVTALVENELGDAILFVDDVQWADPQTSSLMPLLADRVRLVAAIRRGDPGTPAALEAVGASGAELLPLDPLSQPEAAALARMLHPGVSETETKRLVERSGGNPFLLEQLVATGEPSGGLRLMLAARLRALTPAGRDAMAILAILGRPADAVLLGSGADEIVEAGLAAANGQVAIRHALLAEAMIATLPDEQRFSLHSRIAGLLDDPGEAARHHAAAGERALAHEKALVAAERASTPGERAAHLGVAAAHADGPEADSLRLDAARGLIAVAEYAAALGLVESLHPTKREAAAEAALLRSQCYYGLVQADDADRELAAAGAIAITDARLRVRIVVQEARRASRDGQFEEMLAISEHARRLSEEAGLEGKEVAEIFAVLGHARMFVGAPDAIDTQRQALSVARRTGATELEFAILSTIVFGLLLAGEPAQADAVALEAVERAKSLRLLMREHTFRGWHAGLMWHLGDPLTAAAEAESVLAEAVSPLTRDFVAYHWWQGMIDLGKGDVVRADVESRAWDTGEDEAIGDALWALADLELAAGRPEAAERAAAAYFERFNRAWPFVGVTRAWAQFESGKLPAHVGETPLALAEAAPLEIGALVALSCGDAAGAARLFAQAAGLWDGRHVRGAIRCRWAAGESLRRCGARDEAREQLLAVEAEAEDRQLNVLLRKIRRSLRLAGVQRTVARTNAGVLTGREAEVLTLAGEGLTNKEIARRLGIGLPTVVRLIRTASVKLGAKSRAQAALLARR